MDQTEHDGEWKKIVVCTEKREELKNRGWDPDRETWRKKEKKKKSSNGLQDR